ncbi:MAG: arsenate reductase ArsC [Planctomycetota bacterium]|nr:arsenate reductase ArsC [Planctomycetota bacterium]
MQSDAATVKRVLILCTGNSCRSQMAEALWNHLAAGKWEAFSAGSKPAGYVHPLAITAMQDLNIDLSGAVSKHVDQFANQPFELVVTVCDNAQEACPIFPQATTMLHWPFKDPADFAGSESERQAGFARVRDLIANRIREFLATE